MVRVPSLAYSSTNEKTIKDCISFGSRSRAGVVWDYPWEEVIMG